jgi:hypothetical protein
MHIPIRAREPVGPSRPYEQPSAFRSLENPQTFAAAADGPRLQQRESFRQESPHAARLFAKEAADAGPAERQEDGLRPRSFAHGSPSRDEPPVERDDPEATAFRPSTGPRESQRDELDRPAFLRRTMD